MSLKDTYDFQDELNLKDSTKRIKEIMKGKKTSTKRALIPGNFVFTSYDAKDKDALYDMTPMFLVLRSSGSHTLGLNLHWLPYNKRLNIVKDIIKRNKARIKKGLPIKYNYSEIKSKVRSLKATPCVRLYINKRLQSKCIKIPGNSIREIIRLNTESFSNGMSSQKVYKMAMEKRMPPKTRRGQTKKRKRI